MLSVSGPDILDGVLAMAPVKNSVIVDQNTVIDLNEYTIYAIT